MLHFNAFCGGINMIFNRDEVTIRLSKYQSTGAYKLSVEDTDTGNWLNSARYYEKGKLNKALEYISLFDNKLL